MLRIIKKQRPAFNHHCADCQSLGGHYIAGGRPFDLYACAIMGAYGSIVVRWGDGENDWQRIALNHVRHFQQPAKDSSSEDHVLARAVVDAFERASANGFIRPTAPKEREQAPAPVRS